MKDEQIHRSPKIVEYWETQQLPRMHKTSQEFRNALVCLYTPESLNTLFQEPFLSPEEIERKQFLRIRQLVKLAYNNIPLYRNKYQEVGFEPGDLKSWEDCHCLPVVTKDELIEAFPDLCVNPNFEISDLFPTRSSDSTCKT